MNHRPSAPSTLAPSAGRTCDRRTFLQGGAAAALVTALHPPSLLAAEKQPSAPNPDGPPRLRHLQLQTTTPLDTLKGFYCDSLGFALRGASDRRLTLAAGATEITFLNIASQGTDPWYHVAFNIPQNKLLPARRWQLRRTPLVPSPARLQDPAFPDDVRHFRAWNAHSVFFYDPAGNLLEYIARHDLSNDTPGAFSPADILYASEIGLSVEDQQEAAEHLHGALDLAPYPLNTDRWWAMGDELGLVLCLRRRLWGEETGKPKWFGVFPTVVTMTGASPRTYTLEDYPYQLDVL